MRQARCTQKDFATFCDASDSNLNADDDGGVKYKLNIPEPRRNSSGVSAPHPSALATLSPESQAADLLCDAPPRDKLNVSSSNSTVLQL